MTRGSRLGLGLALAGAPLTSDTALRAEALVLLAVVRYYQGNDSATTAAFRYSPAIARGRPVRVRIERRIDMRGP